MNYLLVYTTAAALMLPHYFCLHAAQQDRPAETITITATKAICKKKAKQTVELTYQGNVHARLHNGTRIDADSLMVILCTNKQEQQRTTGTGGSFKQLKELQAHGSLVIRDQQRTLYAQHAQLDSKTGRLKVWQDVIIRTIGDTKQPSVELTGQEAVYDLETGHASLVGNSNGLVQTTISFPPRGQKKNLEKKQS